MEEKLRLLNHLSNTINVNDFYLINVWLDKIVFQGRKTDDKIAKYGPDETDSNGFLIRRYETYEIVLT